MKDKCVDQIIDNIIKGQKAAMDAVEKVASDKNAAFIIGVISTFEGQVNALKSHLLKSVPSPFKTMALLEIAKEIYNDNVETKIISYKKKVEDEDND